MEQAPEFVMPDLEPAPDLPPAPTESTPSSLGANDQPTTSRRNQNQTVGGVLTGVAIGVALTSLLNQAQTEQTGTLQDNNAQEVSLFNGVGDVEATHIGAPEGTHIITVDSNPTRDSITVEFQTSMMAAGEAYRLTASQPEAEPASERQATSNILGVQDTTAKPGDTQEATLILDLDKSHSHLPYQVSLGQFDAAGVLKEVDSAKILVTEMCEPPLQESASNIYCWNSQ